MKKDQTEYSPSAELETAEETLQLMAAALEAAANPIIISSLAGKIVWVNRAFEQLSGYTREEAIGQDTRLLKSGQHSPSFYKSMWETILSGQKWRGDLVNRRKDGSLYHEEMTITPVRNCHGEISHFIAIKLDITKRKRAEERICRLAQAVENVSELIAMGDCDGKIAFANQAFLQAHGYSEKEILGKTFQSTVLSSKNRQGLHEDIMFEILNKRGWKGECLHRRKDGTDFPVYLSVGQIKDSQSSIIGSFYIAQDIAERKQAEEALRRSEARVQRLVESNIIGISIGDLNGKLIDANDAFLKLVGYDRAELLSGKMRWDEMTPPEYRESDQRAVEKLRNTGVASPWEKQFFHKDGSRVSVLIGIATLPRAEGDECVSFVLDIGERKRLEEQFRAAQKMEAVGRLAGGIAHDFNNLLGVVIGYSELLLDRFSPDDPTSQHLQEIKKAGSRAASLTRQLLAFSRKQVFLPRVLDLNAVVADLNKMLQRLIGEDIELITTLRPALGRIKADPGQLEQVLVNLVVNARDAMPTGGKLAIATANVDVDERYCRSHPTIQPGPYVMLAVSDTGIGMDAETQARIFEPFFTTKEQGKGTGLGLATVYGVIKQSEGYIWVYSEPGRGTTFKIYLPRVDKPVEAVDIDRPKTELPRGTETILMAEDDDALRKLACSFLENNGYTVLLARNGAEAIKMAAEHCGSIHMLLTDVVMPRMSGRELANHLTATHPEMRVVYMSGYTDDSIAYHGVLELGTVFIEKPFSREALLGKVREALDQRVEQQL